MSNSALKLLLPDLQRRFKGVEFILTRRLNQDVLENFFGVIRAKGGLHDHPNALEFKYRLRSYIMGRNEGAYSDYTNVEVVDTPDLPLSGQLIKKVNNKSDPLIAADSEEPELEFKELDQLTYDGLENLAGFLCYKLKDPSIESDENTDYYTWVDHLSEGGLHKPSKTFLLKIQELEKIFRAVNGDSILVSKKFISDLISKSNNIDCSEKAKSLFFRSRMYFRIKELNRSLNSIKLGKRKILKVTT